ncbi:MAG: DNA adenine methylase [Bacteroidales bacterium]|jgi:DNA adenine methylase|nr:DNA adenine methylase [Bacteroidales bacterium]MDY0084582.1 DNA adenine methylase [Bacteroidales bacterium]
MKIPHPIPYQGSKRNLAADILRFFPQKIDRLIEPFAGSAAITIASAYYFKAEKFIVNDINEPLIKLWEKIVNEPQTIIRDYHHIWNKQLGNEEAFYYQIRDNFNQTKEPKYLLFLLAKCVKAAVRYNAEGNFNQSPDKRRKGRLPENMRNDILHVSNLLKDKATFYSVDYEAILDMATEADLVYMDPPYQGTAKNGGFRYMEDLNHENFIISLFKLNKRNIPFILSYDGRTDNKIYGEELPKELNLHKIEIDAGRSSIATLHSRNERTYEAVYISDNLASISPINKQIESASLKQPSLFDFA